MLALFLVIGAAGLAAAQGTPDGSIPDPNLFGPVLKPQILAEQFAVNSGDGEAILSYSRALAVASLQLLIRANPNDQQSRKALEALPMADRLVTDLPTELLLLRAELSAGETAEAAGLEQSILRSNPDSAGLRVNLSKVRAQSSDLDGAVREAVRAVQLDPNSLDAQIAAGMAWWELNDFGYNEDSLRAFTAAQKLDPQGYASNLSVGLIESQYHQFDQAEIHLRAAAAADPSAAAPWYQLGMNAYERRKAGEARDALEKYLSLAESGRSGKLAQVRLAMLTLDRIAAEEGSRLDPARAAAEKALKEQIAPPANTMAFTPDASHGVVDAASTRESPLPHGQDVAAQGVRATPEQLRDLAGNSLNDFGTALARKHEYAAAVLPFRYAAEEDPALDPVLRNLGFSAYFSGAYEESEEALEKVAAAHPEDGTSRAYLGMAQFSAGDDAAASATFQALGPALSSNALVEATAAAAYARSGDRPRAATTLDEIGSVQDAKVLARASIAWLDLGDVSRSRDAAKAAVAVDPQSTDALHVLGEIALEQGDATEAAHELQEELKIDNSAGSDAVESRLLLAAALVASGRRTEGERMARGGARAQPESAAKLRREGESLLQNGDSHEGYAKLAAASVLDPANPKLLDELAAAKRLMQNGAR